MSAFHGLCDVSQLCSIRSNQSGGEPLKRGRREENGDRHPRRDYQMSAPRRRDDLHYFVAPRFIARPGHFRE